jgi:uncharacterized membrane protein YqhA
MECFYMKLLFLCIGSLILVSLGMYIIFILPLKLQINKSRKRHQKQNELIKILKND